MAWQKGVVEPWDLGRIRMFEATAADRIQATNLVTAAAEDAFSLQPEQQGVASSESDNHEEVPNMKKRPVWTRGC